MVDDDLPCLLFARAARLKRDGYRGCDFYSLDARDALVAVILATWPESGSRFESRRRRESQRRDRTVASLRRNAVPDSDWLVWGRDYYLPWRPSWALEAEATISAATLDIVVDRHGIRNRDTSVGLACWAVISVAGEAVRVTAKRLGRADCAGGYPALDGALCEVTRAALDLQDSCKVLSETPRDLTEAQVRRTVAGRLAERPTVEIAWRSLVDQLAELIGMCNRELAAADRDGALAFH